MKRVTCVWLPEWSLQRVRSAQPALKNRAIVLFAEVGTAGIQVVTGCRLARKKGIVPGMPLAEAKGRCGSRWEAPTFLPADVEGDVAALREWAVRCQRFGPMTGIEEPDKVLLDVSGCSPLFGGEANLLRQLVRGFAKRGFFARATMADTLGAAWAVARFGERRMTIVPPGGQAEALSPLPIPALRLPAAVIETLDELAIRRIEQLQALPRASLAARVGPEVARRLDQALGEVQEFFVPIRPPQPVEASREFEFPLQDRLSLNIVLRQLVTQILEEIVPPLRGVQQFRIDLIDTQQRTNELTIGTVRPSRSVEHWRKLVETRMESVALTDEIIGVRVIATTADLPPAQQFSLFGDKTCPATEREFAELMDRLSSRLGKERVVRAQLQPEAQPECSVTWQPVLEAGPSSIPHRLSEPRPLHTRPLRLRHPPVPVEVVSVVPDGPPIRLLWNHHSFVITRHWGPERIETGWWRDRPIRRDYYRVETDRGEQFWLFRPVGQSRWFLHGEFE